MWLRAPATGFLSLRTSSTVPSHTLVIARNVWLLNNTLPYNNSSRNNSANGIITRGIMPRNNSVIRGIITRGIMPRNNSVIREIIARGIMPRNISDTYRTNHSRANVLRMPTHSLIGTTVFQ